MRLVPEVRRLFAALREGNTTSDLDEPAIGDDMLDGDTERLRDVVGRDFPFLKNGTFTGSADAMAVKTQATQESIMFT